MNTLKEAVCVIGAAFGLASCASKPPETSLHQCDTYDRHVTVNAADGRGPLLMGTRTDTQDIALKTGERTIYADIWANGGVAADHTGATTLDAGQLPKKGDTLEVVIDAHNKMKSCDLIGEDGDIKASFKPGIYAP